MDDKLIKNGQELSDERSFFEEAITIVEQGITRAYRVVNNSMLETYWLLGKRIVLQEQQGKVRADYGIGLLERLSAELNRNFGKGYSVTNLKYFRQFYLVFSDTSIRHTMCDEFDFSLFSNISWSHIRSIMRVRNEVARLWYLKEASEQVWDVRTLDRNIGSQYYERMLLSQHKDLVKDEMLKKTTSSQTQKYEFIKNPVIVEFLGLSVTDFTETELEKAIISNLQNFLIELGKGFAFVKRQQHIRTEERDYYIDLVFYNYILKSFVLIDLKTTQVSYQDVGQMDMYVQMYDELKRTEQDNPTIGIILCSETDSDVARYSILAKNNQLFASKYKLYMPTEDELKKEIERQKEIFGLQQANKEDDMK